MMLKHWKNRLAPMALGVALLGLVGCEAAEQSAQKLAEEAKKEAQALLSDSVGEVVNEVNRQVDALQESTNRAMGKVEQDDQDKQDEDAEQDAAKVLEQSVET
ncbi:hypothetical protein QU755_18650 [Pseudomonas wenzhouensis]|nr:hypothetical protein [Pseudomonas wenzhouensis]MDM9653420.1 hypothetical protein [Pseudomonas wenzhouensis]